MRAQAEWRLKAKARGETLFTTMNFWNSRCTHALSKGDHAPGDG